MSFTAMTQLYMVELTAQSLIFDIQLRIVAIVKFLFYKMTHVLDRNYIKTTLCLKIANI